MWWDGVGRADMNASRGYLADGDGAHHHRCSVVSGGRCGPQVDNEEGEGQQAEQVDDQIEQVNFAPVRQPARDSSVSSVLVKSARSHRGNHRGGGTAGGPSTLCMCNFKRSIKRLRKGFFL